MANDLLLLGCGLSGVHPSLTIGNGLVAHWKLDEASGTRNDSVGTLHLTDNNTVTQTTGKLGNCAQFVAANSEYLSVADGAPLPQGNVSFTIAAWVNLTDKTAIPRAIASQWNGTGSLKAWFLNYGGTSADRFQFGISANGSANQITANFTFGAPTAGVWYLVIAWYDAAANIINLSTNEIPHIATAVSGGIFDTTAQFRIGALATPGGENFMNGLIDSVSIWNRVLSASEQSYLYGGGIGREYPF